MGMYLIACILGSEWAGGVSEGSPGGVFCSVGFAESLGPQLGDQCFMAGRSCSPRNTVATLTQPGVKKNNFFSLVFVPTFELVLDNN